MNFYHALLASIPRECRYTFSIVCTLICNLGAFADVFWVEFFVVESSVVILATSLCWKLLVEGRKGRENVLSGPPRGSLAVTISMKWVKKILLSLFLFRVPTIP